MCWAASIPGPTAAALWPAYVIGADVSYVQQEEDSGAQFYDTDGTPGEILHILKSHGFNFIRLRTFVDPGASDGYATMMSLSQPYCDLAHTITMGKRIKDAGLGLHLDFHYSDNWADPGKQVIPLGLAGELAGRDGRRPSRLHQGRRHPAGGGGGPARHGSDRQRDHARAAADARRGRRQHQRLEPAWPCS